VAYKWRLHCSAGGAAFYFFQQRQRIEQSAPAWPGHLLAAVGATPLIRQQSCCTTWLLHSESVVRPILSFPFRVPYAPEMQRHRSRQRVDVSVTRVLPPDFTIPPTIIIRSCCIKICWIFYDSQVLVLAQVLKFRPIK